MLFKKLNSFLFEPGGIYSGSYKIKIATIILLASLIASQNQVFEPRANLLILPANNA
jgi:hypothetical protein